MVFNKLDPNLSGRNHVLISVWESCALNTFWKILGMWDSSCMSQGLVVVISGHGIAAESNHNHSVTLQGWCLP